MICHFCRDTILESGKTWDHHHRAFEEFQASVLERCFFCLALAKDLGGQAEHWFHGCADGNGVYRWTLRQTPKTQESQDSVILTFRPVSEEGSNKLPAISFHLLPEEGEP